MLSKSEERLPVSGQICVCVCEGCARQAVLAADCKQVWVSQQVLMQVFPGSACTACRRRTHLTANAALLCKASDLLLTPSVQFVKIQMAQLATGAHRHILAHGKSMLYRITDEARQHTFAAWRARSDICAEGCRKAVASAVALLNAST